jgi:hypothetical protein
MSDENAKAKNALTAVGDGFDLAAADPSASPIRGTDLRFNAGKTPGEYTSYGETINVDGQQHVVIDMARCYQKLAKGCPPEFCMQMPGEPRPPAPHVDQKDWSVGLSGKAEYPWKWTTYLYLLNVKTGEMGTFSTNTIGGNLAIKNLSEQIRLMRQMQPGAIPIVELQQTEMPTQFGGTKPRPYFLICGWKIRGDGEPQKAVLPAPEERKDLGPPAVTATPKTGRATKPKTSEAPSELLLNDSVDF